MKHFHKSYKHRSTETERKVQKLKTHRSEEKCKCYTPLVKLHWHDCPVLRKPCPVHGNALHQEKVEPEQNITISFHPSTKTERLFQPVKSLLAHCNPDTKINFQYYSPKDFMEKEIVKDQFIQTNPEELKRTFSNNIFVEKTKSFVADKTNKMKKLKQCFHSPCDSIIQKTHSQTSFREIERPKAYFNPPDEESGYELFSCSKFGLKNLKNIDGKRDSDFITVTHQEKNNINHKIFEIKHKKGLNDLNFVEIPKQPPQFVYSTYNSGHPENEVPENNTPGKRKLTGYHRSDTESKDDKLSSSEKCDSSSSGSLYVTPFILMPEREDDKKEVVDESVQVEVPTENLKMTPKQTQTSLEYKTEPQYITITPERAPMSPKETQTSLEYKLEPQYITIPPERTPMSPKQTQTSLEYKTEPQFVKFPTEKLQMSPKQTQTSWECHIEPQYITPTEEEQTNSKQTQTSLQSKIKETLIDEKPKVMNFSQQTLPLGQEKYSQQTKEIFLHDFDPSEETLEDRYNYEEKPSVKRIISDESFNKNKWPKDIREKKESSKYTKTTEVQTTSGHRYKEVLITRWDRNLKHEISQTEPLECCYNERYKYSEPKLKKHSNFTNKETQTSFNTSSEFSELSKFTALDYSNATIVINSDQPEFGEFSSAPKTWTGKSYSESDLCKKSKCVCMKTENVIPLFQSCFCKNSDLSPYMSSFKESFVQSTSTKVFETYPHSYDNEPKKTEELPKKEQTSTKEDLTAAISDLSELKRMIHEFFEKAEFSPKKTQEKETTPEEQPKIDSETMTDSVIIEKPKQKLNAEAQTSVDVLLDEEEKLKGQKVKFRQSVILDDDSKTKTFFICALCGREINTSVSVSTNTEKQPKLKEKTTEYSETITVKTIKKTQNDASKGSRGNTKPIAVDEETLKTLKRGSQSSQKSGIPIPVFSKNEERIPFEARTPETFTVEWEKQKVTTSHSKAKSVLSKSQTVSQPLRHCVCTDIPGSSRKNLSIADSGVSSKPKTTGKLDTQSSPKPEPSGVQNKNSENAKKAFRRPDEFIYPVIIKQFWPRDYIKTWQSMEKSDDTTWPSLKQKRRHDKGTESTDIPLGKKIKGVCEEFPKDCFRFGKSSSGKSSVKKKPGFIWIPTSASQIFSKKNLFHHSKPAKSEESIKLKNQQQNSVKRYNGESSNDIFSVRRCHLKRIPFANDRPQPECGCCKSLTYWKPDNDITCPFRPNLPFEPPQEGRQLTEEQPSQTQPNFLEECSYLSEDRISDYNSSEDETSEIFEEEPESNPRNHTFEESFYYDACQKFNWINKNEKRSD